MTFLMPRGGPPGKRALNGAAEVHPRRNAAQRAAKQTRSREVSRTLLGHVSQIPSSGIDSVPEAGGAGIWSPSHERVFRSDGAGPHPPFWVLAPQTVSPSARTRTRAR